MVLIDPPSFPSGSLKSTQGDSIFHLNATNDRKKITPFLLEKIGKLTEGKSLEANIQLVYNNAKLATKIAIAFAKERKKYNF